jgi:cell division protein FtsB
MNLAGRPRFDGAARARALRGAVWILAGVLLFHLFLGEMGIVAGLRQRHHEARLRREVADLQRRTDALMDDVRALKTDAFRIESIARDQLGLARPGEIVFLFPRTGGADRD